jgi:hypothetical protein
VKSFDEVQEVSFIAKIWIYLNKNWTSPPLNQDI